MNRLAGSEATPAPISIEITPSNNVITQEGVPISVIRYFGIDTRKIDNKDKEQLKEIYIFIKDNPNGLYTILSNIERKLGAPSLGETRFGRIWNYLKLTNQIDNLEKDRKALEKHDELR